MNKQQKELLVSLLGVIFRGALAFTFIWACIHKIANPYEFGLQVATYQILPLSMVNLQAVILPVLELLCGVLLIVGFWTRPAALVTCGMNIMFIAAISIALSNDLQLQCGCFASAEAGHEMDSGLILRDLFFLGLGAVLVVMPPDRFTLDRFIERRRQHA